MLNMKFYSYNYLLTLPITATIFFISGSMLDEETLLLIAFSNIFAALSFWVYLKVVRPNILAEKASFTLARESLLLQTKQFEEIVELRNYLKYYLKSTDERLDSIDTQLSNTGT